MVHIEDHVFIHLENHDYFTSMEIIIDRKHYLQLVSSTPLVRYLHLKLTKKVFEYGSYSYISLGF